MIWMEESQFAFSSFVFLEKAPIPGELPLHWLPYTINIQHFSVARVALFEATCQC